LKASERNKQPKIERKRKLNRFETKGNTHIMLKLFAQDDYCYGSDEEQARTAAENAADQKCHTHRIVQQK